MVKLYDKGPQVLELQKALSAKGFVVLADGIFGKRTETALKDFQLKYGLKPDGIFGILTENVLFDAPNPIGSDLKGKGATIIPFAEQMPYKMKTNGKYSGGYPKGAIVHFDASHWKTDDNTRSVMKYGQGKGYAYLEICYSGKILQAHPVNQWGSHGGVSGWKGLVGGVSDDLIGIEMANPGKLTKQKDGTFKSYYGETIKPELVRYVEEKTWGCPTGYYMKYSKAQEDALIKLLFWLKLNDPYGVFNFDFVVGHHEVAGKLGIGYFRKNDPGGALSMSMPDFRKLLKDTYSKV